MAEYIEREALLGLYVDGKYDTADYRVPVPVIIQNIKDIPAADVRPVVFCRDCKHNININKNWNACQLTELYDSVKPDDFCSRGEKMEES